MGMESEAPAEPVEPVASVDPVDGRSPGALADPDTRRAVVRGWIVAVVAFVVGLVLVVLGFTRINGAERHQDDLLRDGTQVSGIVLQVDHPIPGVSWATFSYPAGGERQRHRMLVFNDYERGEKVAAFVRPADPGDATLAGETPMSAAGWMLAVGSLVGGLVLVGLGISRLLRAARTSSIVRREPWTPWTMVAIYPKRRRLAAIAEGETEEHLVRVGRADARRLGRLERRSPLYLAGNGRWFVLSPTEGRRMVALGRMDEPFERLHLVGEGAHPDRFVRPADEPPPDEVF
ncbi:MAG: hypothetical protein U0P45_16040 [Acidimicrobiales bacterium]